MKNRMRQAMLFFVFLELMSIGIEAQSAISAGLPVHQSPDADGIYYTGPEVSTPKMLRTFVVPYPDGISDKFLQGMTVLAMVINANGVPAHIQVLHSHGEAFDQAAIAAVKHSTFEPGKLGDKPVPVWIDVRVVFHANRSQAIPQVLIAERDLPPPDESQLEDKHHSPLSYTPPFAIHTVDADFADPFVAHPYVEVAIVTVLVNEEGIPKDVHMRRGLGFGLDQKAVAAVWHYRFLPATKRGKPITASTDMMVNFAKF